MSISTHLYERPTSPTEDDAHLKIMYSHLLKGDGLGVRSSVQPTMPRNSHPKNHTRAKQAASTNPSAEFEANIPISLTRKTVHLIRNSYRDATPASSYPLDRTGGVGNGTRPPGLTALSREGRQPRAGATSRATNSNERSVFAGESSTGCTWNVTSVATERS